MLIPELFYETDECAKVGAECDGRRNFLLHVTPINLLTHVVVAPGLRDLVAQMLEISGEVTLLVNICSQESKSRSLHVVKGYCVHALALRLMWNIGPDCGMVCAAH